MHFSTLLVVATILTAKADRDSDATAPFSYYDQLKSKLSSENAFQVSQVDDWVEQCVRPFADLPITPDTNIDLNSAPGSFVVSNYQLFLQPSGLCCAHVNCAYEKCNTGPYPLSFPMNTYNSSVFPDELWKSDDNSLDLPDAVVHPEHVGDVSETVKFASKHKIGVSVKTSGHSYTGSSTKKGTILLHLSKLQKYSPSGSIVECQIGQDTIIQQDGAYHEACDLAIARKKQAVIRVGGGEIFDEPLRAVSFDWNGNNNRKYHIVTGAAGTVSAAGGWLASGGLSGNNGMRLYGMGIDQVLHVELVLPSGTHVRFGPTDWEEETDRMYPVTTKVTGYCNMGDLSDEDSWDWQDCSDGDNIDFHDLWYAVRGGGGGAYGVVTSVYYQLHEFSPMQVMTVNFMDPLSALNDDELMSSFLSKWVEFALRFFFLPETLPGVNVTKFESNSCGSPAAGGLKGGTFVCFNGAGDVMKDAWGEFYGNEFSSLDIDSYFPVINQFKSWAEVGFFFGSIDPTIPEGRLFDSPKPGLSTRFRAFKDLTIEYMMFPLDVVVEENMGTLVSIFMDCFSQDMCNGNFYTMGGMIPSANDGLNSLPAHRRNGALLTPVFDRDIRTKFYQLFYAGVTELDEHVPVTGDEEDFPGQLCHNHASADFPLPLKEDWTKWCDPSWSQEEKEAKCFSFEETAWGTSILKKLEKIHTSVDPNRLFNCWDCVGYDSEDKHNKSSKGTKKTTKKSKAKVGKKTKASWEYDDLK